VLNKIQQQNIVAEKWPDGLRDADRREENSNASKEYLTLTEDLKNGEIWADLSVYSDFHFQNQEGYAS
jgi:hypothetical protein